MEGIAQTKECLDVRKTGPNYKKFQKVQTDELKAIAESLSYCLQIKQYFFPIHKPAEGIVSD